MKCKVSTWEDKSIRKAKWNVCVGMGLESGNQRVLSWLKGAGISVEQNRDGGCGRVRVVQCG